MHGLSHKQEVQPGLTSKGNTTNPSRRSGSKPVQAMPYSNIGMVRIKEYSGYLFVENNASILTHSQHPGRNARVSLLDMVTGLLTGNALDERNG